MGSRSVNSEMTTHTANDPFQNYDRWLEEPYQRQQDLETECPNCRESMSKNDAQCPHCGHNVEDEYEPDYDRMADEKYDYDQEFPYGDHGHEYSKVLTSKFHVLGEDMSAEAPAQVPGQVDHSRVDQMSEAQMGAHQRLVNYAVTKLNEAITNGGAIDASYLENLKLDISGQFGIPAQESETIVDAAMRQTQNQDGTLDALAPTPPEQAAAPAAPPQSPGAGAGVGQGPEPVPLANGAFVSKRGLPAKVTHTWHDMYGDQWVELQDSRGYRESVLASEIKTGVANVDNPVTEIRTFLRDTEPKSLTASEIKARISNLKLACQEIRKLVANKKVSDGQSAQLDRIRDEAEVELLNLTDAKPVDAPRHDPTPVEAIFDVADHVAPTLYGLDEISYMDTEPEIDSDDIEAAIPEEAAVFAAEHEDTEPAALLSMAASHIDAYTAGHPSQVRAHHRSRFVEAVKSAAVKTRRPDTTRTSSTEDDLSLYDGPAEAIFMGGN